VVKLLSFSSGIQAVFSSVLIPDSYKRAFGTFIKENPQPDGFRKRYEDFAAT
jgi:hypothetical protein